MISDALTCPDLHALNNIRHLPGKLRMPTDNPESQAYLARQVRFDPDLWIVEVEDRVKHALYGKVLRRTRKLKVHDEQNACGIGDRVLMMETRPLSATKRWRVVEILEKAK